uniref:Uncharacterized protein n=1 Tax=Sinocyclocheilus grahami TaxID=75366 RepID=A0A672KAL8_SINGR
MLCEQKYGALINSFSSAPNVIIDLEARGCKDFISRPIDCSRNEVHPSSQDSTTSHRDSTVLEPAAFQPSISPDIKLAYWDIIFWMLLLLSCRHIQSVCELPHRQHFKRFNKRDADDICMFFFFFSDYLWANDLSGSRTMRLRRTLQSYLTKEFLDENKIHITSTDGRQLGMTEEKSFDRVSIGQNVWKRMRTDKLEERLGASEFEQEMQFTSF